MTNKTERFREVEPLGMRVTICHVATDLPDGVPTVQICDKWCDITVAKQIRDWLTRALPPEYCECKAPVSASNGAYCCDCGKLVREDDAP